MKSYPLIVNFDAAKFAARYGLSLLEGRFYISEGMLVVPDGLPDDPPIQEVQDDRLVILRRLAKLIVDEQTGPADVLRAVLLVIIDELNLHALKINSILDAVDAATSLADLKTRIGAITDYPQRTAAQAKQAVKDKIDTGGAD
jgi:hypothetical protein